MHSLIVCKSCGNRIATVDNDLITIRHRGRTIKVHGFALIECEECQTENRIEAKCIDKENLCRLRRDKSAV